MAVEGPHREARAIESTRRAAPVAIGGAALGLGAMRDVPPLPPVRFDAVCVRRREPAGGKNGSCCYEESEELDPGRTYGRATRHSHLPVVRPCPVPTSALPPQGAPLRALTRLRRSAASRYGISQDPRGSRFHRGPLAEGPRVSAPVGGHWSRTIVQFHPIGKSVQVRTFAPVLVGADTTVFSKVFALGDSVSRG